MNRSNTDDYALPNQIRSAPSVSSSLHRPSLPTPTQALSTSGSPAQTVAIDYTASHQNDIELISVISHPNVAPLSLQHSTLAIDHKEASPIEEQDSYIATLRRTLSRRFSIDQTTSRIIDINDSIKNSARNFSNNHVSTAKYTKRSFVPKFLLEQFSKYANVFFLFTAVLQQVPGQSPTNQYDTIAPLAIVLIFAAIKEISEDVRRHHNDAEVNDREAEVLAGSSWVKKHWKNIAVGEIVWVKNNDNFPADLVLLSTSEPDSICYIETANLDGETNLKIKQAQPETTKYTSASHLTDIYGIIESEQPNSSLYTYEGTLKIYSKSKSSPLEVLPLDPSQILLRGARLRNTGWAYGIVVFSGHETKLMRNASAAPIKTTQVERATNRQILMLCLLLIVIAICSSVGTYFFNKRLANDSWYLHFPTNEKTGNIVLDFFKNIGTFWILFNNLIPISLIITMEMVKYINAGLIANDLDMYYAPIDMPANVRTSSLVEELGQVNYIFSDKTGTLTCNVMEFKECCVGGIMYREDNNVVPEKDSITNEGYHSQPRHQKDHTDNRNNYKSSQNDASSSNMEIKSNTTARDALQQYFNANDPDKVPEDIAIIYDFMVLLAVCHTVVSERDDAHPNEIRYQASSPDEAALVKGARDFGFTFISRKPTSVSVDLSTYQSSNNTTNSEPLLAEYDVLAINEFNSTRKRMSIIIRHKGKYQVLVKGADSVIFPLTTQSSRDKYQARTVRALEYYATIGLRTLTLAARVISEEEFLTWKKLHDTAATTLVDRSEELDRTAALIEKDLTLLGVTAIEDKLQEGVPQTIFDLAQAGIKIWVLTGDRQETAINIGYSCKLLQPDMELLTVNEDSKLETETVLKTHLKFLESTLKENPEQRFSLVIDGSTLSFAFEPSMEHLFLDLATQCVCVICCRVSPLQKALVVKLVKVHRKAITLAIGDGANDVSMIQAAHIGIGISGMEGSQAARSADIAIGQFRYLKKLLLVHGCWSYHRLIRLILYSFYKNITLYLTQFWFAIFNGFSGQTIYESWILSAFNVFFTSTSPLALGIFDKILERTHLMANPELYRIHQSGKLFNIKIFWSWLLNALIYSVMIFFGVTYFYGVHDSKSIFVVDHVLANGRDSGIWVVGCVMYTTVLLTVLLKAALTTSYWAQPWTYLTLIGSFILWIILLPLYALVANKALGISPELIGIEKLYTNARFWLVIVLVSLMTVGRDFVTIALKRYIWPSNIDILQERRMLKKSSRSIDGSLHRIAGQKDRNTLPRNGRSTSSENMCISSYAFSQSHGQRDAMQIADSDWQRPTGY